MEKSNADKLREFVRKREEIAGKATQVTAWYPHCQGDGYHPGKASIRGPFGRWMLVEGGQAPHTADLYDDAKFGADSMNTSQTYAAIVRELVQALENSKKAHNDILDLGDFDIGTTENQMNTYAYYAVEEIEEALHRAAGLVGKA